MSEKGSSEKQSLLTWIVTRILHAVFLVTRGMTMGVRAACFDAQGRVFLVRHSYLPGWYLPGGGVERGETVIEALHKEIREEGNLTATSTPEIFHVYFNNKASRRDHVVLYRLNVEQTAPRLADWEIKESGFFDPDNLPEDATAATRRRLQELKGEITVSDYW
ncbi:NUDIX domain-containing protein [Rhizobium sp. CG4]|jgi:ADP-ribose pyrophosphatase YjhB (NUDIX family)|uniref:NUDIX domain-containing protein n=1 Tax=Rhizobium/Agrobacterium group TaxID=227290 RepID=UPI00177E872C|nr:MULTISPECIES: NUDIX domain-containing protein [Rhizobium/Agrobacterium group]MBD9387402.1 NUDIX domain-containing protein [Agrobacterium sp. AGB01]MCM2454225.1 NUDIX domain-containing protein [Rhizobium sp. CG4]MCS4241056.1 ADP-ribose pyrophosphatase YjhB (NUDIX family) [Rhizobium sp. BIGb0125]